MGLLEICDAVADLHDLEEQIDREYWQLKEKAERTGQDTGWLNEPDVSREAQTSAVAEVAS